MDAKAERFVPLCAASELKNGERRLFEVEGQPILLIRLGTQFAAVPNRCTHQDFPLDNGRLIGFELICRKHGARFDLRTGKPTGGPAVNRLAIYPVRIVDGQVEIDIDRPAPRTGWM